MYSSGSDAAGGAARWSPHICGTKAPECGVSSLCEAALDEAFVAIRSLHALSVRTVSRQLLRKRNSIVWHGCGMRAQRILATAFTMVVVVAAELEPQVHRHSTNNLQACERLALLIQARAKSSTMYCAPARGLHGRSATAG